MFQRKPLSIGIQRAMYGAAIIATSFSIPAAGQAQSEKLEEIVVTGSRIAQDPNLITSSPVTMVKGEEFSYRGVIRVEDLMNSLPAIVPEFTSTESNGASGTATLDLRGLTSDRTLVLTNGHRMGFGDPFLLAPDINQVPGALIQRVEVLTGGASSTYGSDAMAGVVNFIMKDNFEGVQVNYQYSAYQHDQGNSTVQSYIAKKGFTQAPDSVWDGDANNIDLILGVNSADGKGNITAYLSYRSVDPILQGSRDFSACTLSSSTNKSCGGSATLPTGLFSPFDGTNYYTVSGTNFVPWDGSTYNYGASNYFQRPDQRWTAGLFGHYKINEHVEGYTEFQFMDDYSNAQIAPSGAFFVTSTLSCDNPLMSAQEAATINAAGYPCVPGAGNIVPWYIGRRNVEGGFRNDDLGHTSYRMLAGVRGEITTDWTYDAYANFSRMKLDELYNNDLSITRIGRALNVVNVGGVPTCQSVVDGSDANCVPWNIFQTGGVTQAALDYLRLPLFSKARMQQDQYVGYVTGDLTSSGIVSPYAHDGVKLVLGGEYRNEKMNFQPDTGYQSGDGAGQGSTIPPVAGGVDVGEFFLETKIPIAQDLEWFKSLSLDIGYRYSDYSTGTTTDTYKVAGEWTPLDPFKLRGGIYHAVRNANLRELFAPRNLNLWSGTDPCAGAAPLQTAAQCANSGVTAAMYGSVPDNPAGQFYQISAGTLNLRPETSDSFTVGGVINLDEYVPNLNFSVDYWNIRIDDAITEVDAEYIATQCGLTADPAFCSLVHRNATNGNLWLGTGATAPYVDVTRTNIGFYETSGIDLVINYILDVGSYGNLGFNFRGTWTEKFDQQLAKGAAIDQCAGTWGGVCERPRPEWKHVFNTVWTTPWNVVADLSWRYVEGVDEYNQNRYSAGSRNYLDVSFQYTPTFINIGQTTLMMGVNNVTDNDPPVAGYFADVATYGNGNTIPGTWDSLGRYFFFGVSQKF